MRRVLISGVVAGLFVLGFAGSAVADPTGPVTKPGQHGQECEPGTTPGGGNSSNSPGSPFNDGGTSGSHYAGQQTQNSGNGQNSQYDVACFQQSSH